tara:strand:- start:356 stop:523 length:168 start_codon:yes stop_codon:yes gene_type:complete
MYYSTGGFEAGRGMGFCGWSEANQVSTIFRGISTTPRFLLLTSEHSAIDVSNILI